ncbi:MAG: hypothetical protein JNN15_15345 [Blastocatellia bacterium]|nr:hypothetical protein [Blastocatellia bacterium]
MKRVVFLILLSLFFSNHVFAQGSYGTGKLPNTPPRVKRERKTIVVVESINVDAQTFKGTDEITGDKYTYRVNKVTEIYAEKGVLGLFGKKKITLQDIEKGQRLEIKYNELLPTSVNEIKILKPKDDK